MTENKNIIRKSIYFLCAIMSALSLSMRNTLYEGFCAENKIGNILSRFYNTFNSFDYVDVIVVIAIYVFFAWILEKQKKISVSGAVVSLLLALSFVLATSYKMHNSTQYLFCDSFQMFMTLFEIAGIGVLLYGLLMAVDYYFNNFMNNEAEIKRTKIICFFKNNFFLISLHFMFICWLVWLIFTYPGSVNPDSVIQLKHFYGDLEWTVWQPPFSTMLMGGFFQIGKSLGNAGFGMFLYNLFQGLAGAFVFSYGLNRLVKRGVPFMIPFGGMLFFGLTPMWGAYVQWFEKDFLFTVSVALFVILIAEVIFDRACSMKMLIAVCASGIVMALLRSNGIYAIIPTLIVTVFYMKGLERKKIIAALAIVLTGYAIVTKALYPALGIGRNSAAETIGFMLQATARYVQEYPDEVTDYEREVLSNNFYSYDCLDNYDPRIVDPVKIYYNHSDFGAYFKIWVQMFIKHPDAYIESYLNGAYGYMAPVSRDIGAYINLESYDSYLREHGVEHAENGNLNYLAVWIWNINLGMPLIKYTVSPGLYTWLTIIGLWLVLKNKKKSGVVLLIPNLINILVCTASPLADAMRYALPTVVTIPFMVGWMFLLFGKYEKMISYDAEESEVNEKAKNIAG